LIKIIIKIDEINDKTYLINIASENGLKGLVIHNIFVHGDVTITTDEVIEILAINKRQLDLS